MDKEQAQKMARELIRTWDFGADTLHSLITEALLSTQPQVPSESAVKLEAEKLNLCSDSFWQGYKWAVECLTKKKEV